MDVGTLDVALVALSLLHCLARMHVLTLCLSLSLALSLALAEMERMRRNALPAMSKAFADLEIALDEAAASVLVPAEHSLITYSRIVHAQIVERLTRMR